MSMEKLLHRVFMDTEVSGSASLFSQQNILKKEPHKKFNIAYNINHAAITENEVCFNFIRTQYNVIFSHSPC